MDACIRPFDPDIRPSGLLQHCVTVTRNTQRTAAVFHGSVPPTPHAGPAINQSVETILYSAICRNRRSESRMRCSTVAASTLAVFLLATCIAVFQPAFACPEQFTRQQTTASPNRRHFRSITLHNFHWLTLERVAPLVGSSFDEPNWWQLLVPTVDRIETHSEHFSHFSLTQMHCKENSYFIQHHMEMDYIGLRPRTTMTTDYGCHEKEHYIALRIFKVAQV